MRTPSCKVYPLEVILGINVFIRLLLGGNKYNPTKWEYEYLFWQIYFFEKGIERVYLLIEDKVCINDLIKEVVTYYIEFIDSSCEAKCSCGSFEMIG